MGENAEPQVSLAAGLTSQSGFVGPLTHERIRPCSCELAFARLSASNDRAKVAALNRYFCRDINPESWKDPLRCFLMGAARSTPSPVQAFIVTLSDLLTSYATVRWQRGSLSSHFPEHSGSVTKSSFTSRSCRCSLPAKNKEDKVQSDQGHTQWHGAVWEHTSIKLHVSPKHSNVRRLKLGDLNFAKPPASETVEVHVRNNRQKNLLAPEGLDGVKDNHVVNCSTLFMGSTENSQYMNTKLHVKLTFCLRLTEMD